jgi:anthranilate phosphoribosyltransferase
MDELISGETNTAQTAAFLGALAARRLSAEELAGFAEGLRARADAVVVGSALVKFFERCAAAEALRRVRGLAAAMISAMRG